MRLTLTNRGSIFFLKFLTIALCLVKSPLISSAQAKIGTGSTAESAMLEIESTNRGFLPPRIALSSNTMKLNSTTVNPADGMVVYNTTTASANGLTGAGCYVWRDSKWHRLLDGPSRPKTFLFKVGDIKPFFSYLGLEIPAGWVECNGQVLNDSQSSLNGKTLPNLNNSTFLAGSASAQNGTSLGGGSASITRANLPNVTLSSATTSNGEESVTGSVSVANGSHTHDFPDSYYTQQVNTWKGGGSPGGGYTGYTANQSRTSSSNGSAHTHTATFAGSALAGHSHTISALLNGNVTQASLTLLPQSVGVTWIMKVK